MSNLYYRKDIHKSIEGLLYGLFVYQYLLDTSTFGLVIRCLVQDQLLSLKSKAPTLRVALYTVFVIVFLAFLRHLHPPDRYAVIIDFIGNVSTPSRSKLLWLDLLIASLQVTEALIVFRFIKADNEVRTATRPQRVVSSGASRAAAPSIGSNSRPSAPVTSSRSHAPTASSSRATVGSSRPRTMPGSHAVAVPSEQSSSTLFEYTPERAGNDRIDARDERTAEYYVDEEEERFSVDSDPRSAQHQSSEATRSGAIGSGTDVGSGSESEESEDPLGDDYEEILQQETFVFQLSLQDLTSYLFSSQDAVAFPRPPDPRAGLAAAATSTQASRVRNLPV
ncbi:hypothetical protein BGZ72_001073 [Mortierella alpina]|nr:hypothetical protein BGZ72_001073 [Mortierella alpina]